MKILVITPGNLPVPPIKGGSVETVIDQVFSRLAKTNQITLISCEVNVKNPIDTNYITIRVPYKNAKDYLDNSLNKIDHQQYDIIQIENRPEYIPTVRETFINTPILLSLHSLTFMEKLPSLQADSILSKTDGVITVSHFVTQTMKKRYPHHANKFKTIHLGVDSEKFSPISRKGKQKIRKKRKLIDKSDYYNILFIGRIVPKKGLHTLIHSAALIKKKYPKINIIAVGSSWPGKKKETKYMRQVKKLSSRLKVPIYFTGYIPPHLINKMYHLGDVFINPTQFNEGLGMVNMEAMTSGIPVIASNRGGIKELIQHKKTGLLVSDYKNPNAFAKQIKYLIEHPKLVKNITKNARVMMQNNFTWDQTVLSLADYYNEIIKKHI